MEYNLFRRRHARKRIEKMLYTRVVSSKRFQNIRVLGIHLLFHNGVPYHIHIETSSLTCSTNQCTGFYIMGTSIMKELKHYFVNNYVLCLLKLSLMIFPTFSDYFFLVNIDFTLKVKLEDELYKENVTLQRISTRCKRSFIIGFWLKYFNISLVSYPNSQ